MNAMYSLYIPRAMTYTTSADVESVFNALFGKSVKCVIERELKDSRGQSFKGFAIHFENFAPGLVGMTQGMRAFDAKMEADGEVKVMTGYKNWFWKVKKYQAKPAAAAAGPRLMTEEDEQRYLDARPRREAALTAFTEDELDELDAATGQEIFSEDELEELESEAAAAQTHANELELAAIADEMANA